MDSGVPDVAGLRRSAIRLDDGRLYLERFHLVETKACHVSIHHWLESDDQRAMHDHPWPNSTCVLAGHLVEHSRYDPVDLTPGTVLTRAATDAHRIELAGDEAWTLFVTGPIERRWGFHTEDGWVHWTDWPHAGHYEGGGGASHGAGAR
jgi:hypothetical protein